MVESLLFIGAGAGEKNSKSQSQPKMDRLHNAGCGSVFSHFVDPDLLYNRLGQFE